MCTILSIFAARADYPLVLATNRDEFFARPATGAVRLLESPAVVGGRDLTAGGTWMGVSREGFVAAVTNQRGLQTARADARSRGELVLDMLKRAECTEVRALLGQLDGRDYNPFNLMFGDARELWVAYGRSDVAEIELARVPEGLHVLPNGKLDSAEFSKCARARELVEPHLKAPWPVLSEALRAALADRQTEPQPVPEGAPAFLTPEMMRELSALCVRTPAYGTRSSNLVAIAPGRCAYFGYAGGPPDRTPFEDVTALFDA